MKISNHTVQWKGVFDSIQRIPSIAYLLKRSDASLVSPITYPAVDDSTQLVSIDDSRRIAERIRTREGMREKGDGWLAPDASFDLFLFTWIFNEKFKYHIFYS